MKSTLKTILFVSLGVFASLGVASCLYALTALQGWLKLAIFTSTDLITIAYAPPIAIVIITLVVLLIRKNTAPKKKW